MPNGLRRRSGKRKYMKPKDPRIAPLRLGKYFLSPNSPKRNVDFLNISVIDKNMKKIFIDQFLARGKEIVFKANIVLLIQYKIKI